MDWYTPPAEPSAPPPISRARCILLALLPPVLHFVLINVIALFIAGPVYVSLLAEYGHLPYEEQAAAVMTRPEYLQSSMESAFFSGLISMTFFFYLLRRNRRMFPETPAPSARPVYIYAVLTGLAGNFFFISSITAFQSIFGTDLQTNPFGNHIEDALQQVDGVAQVLFALSVIFFAPIAEEFCFRGLALKTLLRNFPFWTANIIQAALFGIIHFIPLQIGYAFLSGLLFGWIVRRTGRLRAAITAHIVFNASNIPYNMIPGIGRLTEQPGRLLLLVCLPAAALLYYSIRGLHRMTAVREEDGLKPM
jgi:membrane protease YdiL (CAAX protease family)